MAASVFRREKRARKTFPWRDPCPVVQPLHKYEGTARKQRCTRRHENAMKASPMTVEAPPGGGGGFSGEKKRAQERELEFLIPFVTGYDFANFQRSWKFRPPPEKLNTIHPSIFLPFGRHLRLLEIPPFNSKSNVGKLNLWNGSPLGKIEGDVCLFSLARVEQ